MEHDEKYCAFISYSHADHHWGVWLHKALEKYSVPKRIAELKPEGFTKKNRLGRVFRDEEELGAASELGSKIESALIQSRTLIVLCSPTAAKSAWVEKEISQFKAFAPDRHVLAVIVDGSPNSENFEQECLPYSLKKNADGTPAEPLAVDVRKHGKRDSFLRIVSGLLDIDYDSLKQRETARRRRQTISFFAIISCMAMLITATFTTTSNYLSAQSERYSSDVEALLFDVKTLEDEKFEGDPYKLISSLYANVLIESLALKEFWLDDNTLKEARPYLVKAFNHNPVLGEIKPSSGRVRQLVFVNGDRLLAIADDDAPTAYIVDVRAGRWDFANKLKLKRDSWIAPSFLRDRVFINLGSQIIEWKYSNDIQKHYGSEIEGFQPPSNETDFVDTLASDRSGRFLAVVQARAEKVQVVSVTSASVVATINTQAEKVALSDDANILAVYHDGSLQTWSVSSSQPLSPKVPIGASEKIAFAPNSDVLAFSQNNNLMLLDAANGRTSSFIEHSSLSDFAFSRTGAYLATSGLDGSLKVWHAASETELRSHKNRVASLTSVAFSPSDEYIVTGASDGVIQRWHGVDSFSAYGRGGVESVTSSLDLGKLLLLKSDGAVAIYDSLLKRQIATIMPAENEEPETIAISGSGRFLIQSSSFNDYSFIDILNPPNPIQVKSDAGPIKQLDALQNGEFYFGVDADGQLLCWEQDGGPCAYDFHNEDHSYSTLRVLSV